MPTKYTIEDAPPPKPNYTVEDDPTAEPTLLQKAMTEVGNFATGAGKGALHTLSTGDEFARKYLPAFLTNQNFGFGPPANLEHVHQMATPDPDSLMQKLGYGAEQVGEYFLPGPGEEKAAGYLAHFAPKLARFAKPIARAIGAEGVNEAQGGTPGVGAVTSGAGSAIGAGLKAAAPMLTGVAQGLEPEAYGKTGKAILNETTGVFPGQIRKSAQSVLDVLNPQLEESADRSMAKIPMLSARQAAAEQFGKAQGENVDLLKRGIRKMGNQLVRRRIEVPPGAQGPSAVLPIPDEVSAREYLNLKRGVGKALPAGSWSSESSNALRPARNAVYGTMAKEFENAVPEAAPLNRRINALIPATEKPRNFFFGHPLGAGVGATLGGIGGYRRGIGPEGTDVINGLKEGALGALGGAAAGYAVPAAMNSEARMAYSPALQKVVIPAISGAILQADRKKKEQ